jgi:Subtilase family
MIARAWGHGRSHPRWGAGAAALALAAALVAAQPARAGEGGQPSAAGELASTPFATAEAPYRPGVVIAGFHAHVSLARERAIERGLHATGVEQLGPSIKPVREHGVLRIPLVPLLFYVPGASVPAAVARLRAERAIAYAEPDYLMSASATPNDPFFALQWADSNTGQSVPTQSGNEEEKLGPPVNGTPGADQRTLRTWNVTTGASTVVIGEADTGLQYTHPDLAANVWTNPTGVGKCPVGAHGYNVLTKTCDPMDDDTVYGGHGTHVAGIMGAAGNNATGVAGVNWTTTLLPVKWLNSKASGETSGLIAALQWLISAKQEGVNIRVVNDSATFKGTSFSPPLSEEIDLLGAENILFVTAAGNTHENDDLETSRRYPCDYDRPTELCVTATNNTDQLPTWANWGPHTVQLGAPGEAIYSTLRDNRYGYLSGGSMAAAQVSGAAALVLSVRPAMSAEQVRSDILENVDKTSALQGQVITGGRLNVCRATPGCMPPTNISAPMIEGTAQQEKTLKAVGDEWTNSPTEFKYEWLRCESSGSPCSPIAGATASEYKLLEADVGKKLKVKEVAKNAGGESEAVESALTTTVLPAPPANKKAPEIEGTAQQEKTLKAVGDEWTNSPTEFKYEWLRCESSGANCTAIEGATQQTYEASSADIGHALRVQETAGNAGGSSAPATSEATQPVAASYATFGKSTPGASSSRAVANRKNVSRYPLSRSGTVVKLSIFLQPTQKSGQQMFTGVIYAGGENAPGTLLASSQPLAFSKSNAPGWYDLAFTAPPTLAAGGYWIGVLAGTTSKVASYRYDSVARAGAFNSNPFAAGASNPFGRARTNSVQLSIFATYTHE